MAHSTLAIDAHVHLYQIFDLNTAIERGIENLQKLIRSDGSQENLVPIWLLAERSDASMFEHLLNMAKNNETVNHYHFSRIDAVTITVRKDDRTVLHIFAGRQLISAENLEVLSLVSNYNPPDRRFPLSTLVSQIKFHEGIPVLNWAPGKWFGERGEIVHQLIQESNPAELFIGDSTMRPSFWRTPGLVRKAQKLGFSMLAGSDPLPFSGEEEMIGVYGTMAQGEFDDTQPSKSLKTILIDQRNSLRIVGKRSNSLSFVIRQFKIMREKKTRET